MSEISFLRWDVLWPVAVALVMFAAWLLVRRRRFVAFSAVGQLRLLNYRPSLLRQLPKLLIVLALALIVMALMDPVIPLSESTVEAQGHDIVLVVDLSTSMGEVMGLYTEGVPTVRLSKTGKPFATRLEVIKMALRDFIEQRRGDRIGLVVFSDNAYVISPLTFDREYLMHYADEIDDTLLRTEGMTAIGEGIFLANVLFAKQSQEDAKNKVIVVFTDGEYNTGRDPMEALDETSRLGVRAYMVGVDLEESIKKKQTVKDLIDTIKRKGGQYFQANSRAQLDRASRELGALEKGRLAGKQFVRNVPVFTWFVVPALILILAALGFRVFPYFIDLT